jgi:hypothetical protein
MGHVGVAFLLICCLPLAGCWMEADGRFYDPAVQLELHEGRVVCSERGNACSLPDGRPSLGYRHTVKARIGFRRDEARIAFSIRRASSLAHFDARIGIPSTRAGTPSLPPTVSYREVDVRTGAVRFEAVAVSGRFELSLDGRCPCQTGRLDLQLTDAGPDGKLGSADDRFRRITRARIRRDNRRFCHESSVLPIRDDLLVVGIRKCPVRSGRTAHAGGSFCWNGTTWIGADLWNDDGWYDEQWVGVYIVDEPYDDRPWQTEDWPDDESDDWPNDWPGESPTSADDASWDSYNEGFNSHDPWGGGGGSDDWGSDDWGSDDWGSDDWGSDDWGSDDWGSDDWGSGDWGSDDWGSDDWGDDDWW